MWAERLAVTDQMLATAISQRHNLPELLGRVLAARGVPLEGVPLFLDPTLKSLMPDPATLRDMDRAGVRLADAIMRRETVAIFGDYDVDGACASALLSRLLRHHGVPSRIYIPDRLSEGYGPSVAAIETLVEEGANLIVTVDCGTTSHDVFRGVSNCGANIIVVDHHQADDDLPNVLAVVNPNRQDDLSGQGHLCAAGVVFLLLVAVVRELRRRGAYDAKSGVTASGQSEPNLLQLLDLVALATVADVVPLTGLNRAYVTKGLAVMHARRNTGLRALCDAASLAQPPTPYHLGFILGPRINAGGRIGDAALGARLLCSDDEAEAARIAQLLDKLNRERKTIEAEMLAQAMADAERQFENQNETPVVIVAAEDWHKGVVGLIASRLAERFRRPSCVIAWEAASKGEESLGTASLRSIAGVDVGAIVRAAAAAGLALKGGGHAMAAGLTVEKNKLTGLRTFLEDAVAAAANVLPEVARLDIDGAMTPGAAGREVVDLIERAGPYGQGNPQPRFAFPAVSVRYAKVVGKAHIRCALEASDGRRIDAIAFRATGEPLGDLLLNSGGMPIHVAGSLRRDTWGGRERIELQIADAADPRKIP